jgi:saccharopine dehydrogenase-like NADP-dependent oxidoreductase
MIAMLHKVKYELDGQMVRAQSSMVVLGEDPIRTAMAKTVGLATGIGAKLILEGEITKRGVVIPTVPDVYEPVLAALRPHGIAFEARVEQIPDSALPRGGG